MSKTKIETTCSGCMEAVVIDATTSVVSSKVKSNGVRGQGHVPAHVVYGEAFQDDNGMWLWDCPRPGCGHADSYDADSA